MEVYSFEIKIPNPSDIDWLEGCIRSLGLSQFLGSFVREEPHGVCLVAYLRSSEEALRLKEHLEAAYPYACSAVVAEVDQNWNEAWNQAFESTEVGPYWAIRSIHHPGNKSGPPDGVESWPKPIVLRPGTSFGMGTHATTRLCLKKLGDLGHLTNKTVLDFGTGTGILAIAAGLMGASAIHAVEVDRASLEEAKENARHNRVKIGFYQSLEEVPRRPYDLILANVLWGVLTENWENLRAFLPPSNLCFITSGWLEKDAKEVMEVFRDSFDPSCLFRVDSEEGWGVLTVGMK